MTPIRVQCETCNTRLRVRDPGFVGEVHACPRCGGMVLITAPVIVESATPDPIHPEKATSQDLLPPTTLNEMQVGPSEVTRELLVEIEPTTEPSAIWAKAFAPTITAAALAASAGLLWFVYGADNAVVAEPEETTTATVDEPITEAPKMNIATAPQEEEPSATLPALDQEPIAAELLEGNPFEPIPNTAPSPEMTPPEADPLRIASAEQVAEAPASSEPPSEIDPLDFDPATIDLVLRRGGKPAEAPAPLRPLPPEPNTTPPTVAEVLDERLALAARAGGVSVRRGPTSDESNRPPNLPAGELLQATLPTIDLQKIQLVDAVELFAELTGAPITLTPSTLLYAGVDARRELEVEGEGQKLAQLIGESFEPVRLELRSRGPQAWLTRVGSEEVKNIKHRVGDLAGEQPGEFLSLMESVGPQELELPATLEGDRLPIEAQGATHYELLLLCERLRVARGKPTQTKYPRRMLHASPSLDLLSKTLERRTTFSFVEPTPLRDIVAHWRRATGTVVLVDWRSLGEAGLGPRSTIECAVTNRPWAEALDGVLEPLGLGWAALGETLWVTSLETLATTPSVEFYPAPRAQGEAFAERLADRLSPAGVVHDDASGVAIVRGDTRTQREAYAAWRELTEGP